MLHLSIDTRLHCVTALGRTTLPSGRTISGCVLQKEPSGAMLISRSVLFSMGAISSCIASCRLHSPDASSVSVFAQDWPNSNCHWCQHTWPIVLQSCGLQQRWQKVRHVGCQCLSCIMLVLQQPVAQQAALKVHTWLLEVFPRVYLVEETLADLTCC